METDLQTAAEILMQGGVGVLATDTLYGIVGSALSSETVDRIYALKQRNHTKPLIVLIAQIEDLEQFGVVLSQKLIIQLEQYWPGPYSILLPVIDDQFEYIHRGTDQIAFRIPDKPDLLDVLRQIGPLVAPSANMEGLPPAKTIQEARNYFGTDIDFYVDEDELTNKASTILSFNGDEIVVERA